MNNQNKKVTTKEVNHWNPNDNVICTAYQTGHITEVKASEKTPTNLKRFQWLPGRQYVNTETGEIKPCKEPDEKSEITRNSNRSFENFRRYINLNFFGLPCERHLTLTYRTKMEDRKKVSDDFKKFRKKLQYHYSTLDYISIPEPHASGSWHVHVLIKDSTKENLFLDKNFIEKLWGHDAIWINEIKGNDNIGAYFCCFLSHLEPSEKQSTDKKKERLKYYPPNCKLFTSSNGIRKPECIKIEYGQLKELVGNRKPCFSQTIAVQIEENGFQKTVNRILREEYNQKRKNI